MGSTSTYVVIHVPGGLREEVSISLNNDKVRYCWEDSKEPFFRMVSKYQPVDLRIALRGKSLYKKTITRAELEQDIVIVSADVERRHRYHREKHASVVPWHKTADQLAQAGVNKKLLSGFYLLAATEAPPTQAKKLLRLAYSCDASNPFLQAAAGAPSSIYSHLAKRPDEARRLLNDMHVLKSCGASAMLGESLYNATPGNREKYATMTYAYYKLGGYRSHAESWMKIARADINPKSVPMKGSKARIWEALAKFHSPNGGVINPGKWDVPMINWEKTLQKEWAPFLPPSKEK